VFEEALRAYRKLLDDADLVSDPARLPRVDALQRLYVERRAGLDGDPQVTMRLFGDLRAALPKLSPVAQSFAADLLATVDVEHGTWKGHAVDDAMMDALAAAGNEMTLERFAQRLPQVEMRQEAQRRLVRIHVELSAFPEVRNEAAAVEERVIRDGNNHIRATAITRVRFDERVAPARHVVVQQDVWAGVATMLATAPDRPELSVLPELSFRGALVADARGVTKPITICAPPRELDPSPCIAVADVALANPLAYLDDGGAFHFRDRVAETDVVAIAAVDDFVLPIRVGTTGVNVSWGLTFARPDDLAFSGPGGGRGPDLDVHIEHPSRERYLFTVAGPRGRFSTIVERADLASYRVETAGGGGSGGSSGSTGSTGSSGSECSSGGPGGPGGDGGPGGPGGDGGNAHVVIACGGLPCDVDALRRSVVSLGGAGGPGGSGGAGGAGGSGGSGRSQRSHTDSNGNTVVDDPGCSPGSSGSQGTPGSDGSPGSPGHAGRVTVELR
jgi:hypothetical protein